MKTAKFKMEELTCPSCINKIEGTLLKQEGVNDAKVLFHSSKVKVVFDEKITASESLINIVQKLGYQVLESKES